MILADTYYILDNSWYYEELWGQWDDCNMNLQYIAIWYTHNLYVYFCIDDLNGLRKQLIRLLYVMHCMYHTLLAICMILYSCPHIWIYIDALWKDAHEEFSTTRLPAWLQGAVELLREDWTTGWGLRSWLCGQAWVAVKELRQLGARGKERQWRTQRQRVYIVLPLSLACPCNLWNKQYCLSTIKMLDAWISR